MKFTRWSTFLAGLDYPLIFVDTETTGTQVDRASILEAACAVYSTQEHASKDASLIDWTLDASIEIAPGLCSVWKCRANPGKQVLASGEYRRSVQIHRLQEAVLTHQKPFAQSAWAFADQLTAGYVVGFNSEHYDMPVIVRHLEDAGVQIDDATRSTIDVWRVIASLSESYKYPTIPRACIDTELSYNLPPVFRMSEGLAAFKQNLGTMHEALLGKAPNKELQHGAIYDCMMTANVLAALFELWPDEFPLTIGSLIRRATVPPRNWPDWDHFLHYDESTKEWLFMKGENRGLALHEARRSYLEWIVEKGSFEDATKRVAMNFLRTGRHLYPGVLRQSNDRG